MRNHDSTAVRRTSTRSLLSVLVGGAALAFSGPSTALADASLFCEAGGSVFTGYKLYVKKNSTIHGEDGLTTVHSNGKVKLYDSMIEGDLSATGEIAMKGDSVVTGLLTEHADMHDAPEDPHALVESFRHDNDNHHIPLTAAGEVALDGLKLELDEGDLLVLPGGDYFLEKLSLKKGAVLQLAGDVRIFMDSGKVEVGYGSVAGAQDGVEVSSLMLVISDKGGIKISKASSFHGGIYAPGAKVYVKYHSQLHGPVVAEKIKLYKHSEIFAHDGCRDGLPEVGPNEIEDPPGIFLLDDDAPF